MKSIAKIFRVKVEGRKNTMWFTEKSAGPPRKEKHSIKIKYTAYKINSFKWILCILYATRHTQKKPRLYILFTRTRTRTRTNTRRNMLIVWSKKKNVRVQCHHNRKNQAHVMDFKSILVAAAVVSINRSFDGFKLNSKKWKIV